MVEEVSLEAAVLLLPIFAEHGGRNGRLSMQTDPRLRRNAMARVPQAGPFPSLAPTTNVQSPAASVAG